MASVTKTIITSDATGAEIPAATAGRIAVANLAAGKTSFVGLDFANWDELVSWAQTQKTNSVGLT